MMPQIVVNLTVGSNSLPYTVECLSPLLFRCPDTDGLLTPERAWDSFLYRYWVHGSGKSLMARYKSKIRNATDYLYGHSISPITPTEFLKFCLVYYKDSHIKTTTLYDILSTWTHDEIRALPNRMILGTPDVAIEIKPMYDYVPPYKSSSASTHVVIQIT